ncbi:MAG TPA: ABC transporter permease, partial [Chitinophagales bacterium]|nr:ABC transporter permease [Chitinophagales bacterium]
MIRFFISKIFYGTLVMVGVIIVVFSLFNLLPVDAARLTLGQRADVESVEAVRKELGLDQPKWKQLMMYFKEVSPISVEANTVEAQEKFKYLPIISVSKESVLVLKKPYLRRSYQTKRDVWDILMEAMPQTILLAIASILLACIIGLPLGVAAAVKQYTWFDNMAMTISVIGISVPSYFSAMVLGYFFGILWHSWTGLNHIGGLYVIDDYGNEILEWKNLILPAIALGTRPIGTIFQLTRSSMLEVLSQDYIRTARAKGLTFINVLFKHALRNALNPVVTAVSGWFAALLAGA